MPRITSEFHSIEDVGWYGSVYLLTTTALQPTESILILNGGTDADLLAVWEAVLHVQREAGVFDGNGNLRRQERPMSSAI